MKTLDGAYQVASDNTFCTRTSKVESKNKKSALEKISVETIYGDQHFCQESVKICYKCFLTIWRRATGGYVRHAFFRAT